VPPTYNKTKLWNVLENGAFRPDTGKLLDLLGGPELYGSPFAAVRELLQNAFDAVNERIARGRLERSDPLASGVVEALSATHKVAIKVEQRDNRVYLVCVDNGIGMSKSVLCDYLLVSGRRGRPECTETSSCCHRTKARRAAASPVDHPRTVSALLLASSCIGNHYE
jgi:HSP90 family molecular chaperone